MSKKYFDPFILLGVGNDDDPSTSGDGTGNTGWGPNPGGGSGGNSSGPITFSNWSANFGVDLNGNGAVDFDDYGQWWADQGFGIDAWEEFNPGTPFSWGPDADM